MSRDPNTGTYTLPQLPNDGESIDASDVNVPFRDIEATLNAALPVNKGGTGGATPAAARTGISAQEASENLTTFSSKTFRNRNDLGGSSPDAAGVPSEAAVRAAISAAIAPLLPAGTIWAFGGTAAPSGWLLCDGAAISRTTYAALFTAIGTAFGAGNGSTTFNLPNTKGRVLVGAGGVSDALLGNAVGNTGGARSTTLAEGNLPSHTHGAGTLATESAGAHSHTFERVDGSGSGSTGTARRSGGAVAAGTTSSTGAHSHTITGKTAATGSGQSFTNLPPSLVVNCIIKT